MERVRLHSCRQKITKSFVDGLPYTEEGQRYFFDRELTGFGIAVGTRSKTYFVEKQVKGKCIRRTIGRHGHFTPVQARNHAHQLLHQLALGVDPNAEKRIAEKEAATKKFTLRDAWQQFHEHRSLKPSTRHDYDCYMNRVFSSWLDRPERDITGENVLKLHQELGKRSGPPYANSAMRILRAVLNFAKGRNIIDSNPVAIISDTGTWFPERRRETLIKSHQLPAWFRGLDIIRRRAYPPSAIVGTDYLEFVLFTGLRRDEAASLQWDQIDTEGRSLSIPDTKNHRPHTLPLTTHLETILARREEAAGDSHYVFPSPGTKSRHGYLAEPRYIAEMVTDETGVSFTIHDLRRTFITTAHELGLGYYTIKQLVNHKLTSDVTAGYIVSDLEHLRGPMQQITDYFMAKANQPEQIDLKIA